MHSIAAALFLNKDEFHFFGDIGCTRLALFGVCDYSEHSLTRSAHAAADRHEPFQQCPKDAADRCACNPNDGNNFEDHCAYLQRWLRKTLTQQLMLISLVNS